MDVVGARAPVVSVVMSVFNGGKYLREAVESVLSQTFGDLELIVIDDGSTDASRAVLDSLALGDARLKIYSQSNRGLVGSLNRGCGAARGKYIARMDADDVSLPGRLELQVGFLERNPEIALLGGAVEFIDGDGRALMTQTNPEDDAGIRKAFSRGSPFWHPTVIMRKEALESVNGYRAVVVDAEDLDLWLRLAESCRMANLKDVVLQYRLHPHQLTANKCRQMAMSSLAARAAAAERRAGRPDPLESTLAVTAELLAALGLSERACETAVAERYLWAAKNLCRSREFAGAAKLLETARRTLEWRNVERKVSADIFALAASVYWKSGSWKASLSCTVKAIAARPLVLGRPVRGLWNRIRGLANAGMAAL